MVFPEQQVEDKPSGAHSGTALGMTAGSLLPPGVPSRRALCSPRSLSPPPPSAPHAPPPPHALGGPRCLRQVAADRFQSCSKQIALFSQVSQTRFPPLFDLYAAHASRGYK